MGKRDGQIEIYSSDLDFQGILTEEGDIAKSGRPLRGVPYHIMQDSHGNIWIATKGDGIILAEKEGTHFKFTRFKYDEDDIYLMESEEGLLKIKTVFEGDGKSEEIIIKKILASLNPDIVVNKVITKSMDESKGIFSGLVAIEMFCKPFDIVEVAYKFLYAISLLTRRGIYGWGAVMARLVLKRILKIRSRLCSIFMHVSPMI